MTLALICLALFLVGACTFIAGIRADERHNERLHAAVDETDRLLNNP